MRIKAASYLIEQIEDDLSREAQLVYSKDILDSWSNQRDELFSYHEFIMQSNGIPPDIDLQSKAVLLLDLLMARTIGNNIDTTPLQEVEESVQSLPFTSQSVETLYKKILAHLSKCIDLGLTDPQDAADLLATALCNFKI